MPGAAFRGHGCRFPEPTGGSTLACGAESGPCRHRHIAEPLQLVPNPRSPGDWEGRCPECGHGGFALSQPTLTKMRNMWSCNCRICYGGKGCPTRVTRAAM